MHPIEESVRSALEPYASPELIKDIVLGLRALHENMYVEHEFKILNFTEQASDELLIQGVYDAVQEALVAVCTTCRVTVDVENTTLGDLAKFVRALMLMQFWGCKEDILAITESDAPDEDKLACIVSLVGELSESKAGEIINGVEDTLMRGLTLMYNDGNLNIEPETNELPPAQLDKLRKWRSVMRADRQLAFRMIASGYRPGFAFAEYIKRVGPQLSTMDNQTLANEIIPFILMGRDTWENPLLAWRENNQLLSIEAQDVTMIDVLVVRLLGEFDRLNTNTNAG